MSFSRAFITILFTLLLAANAAAATLTASTGRTQISTNETLELKVRFDEQVLFDEPDFSVLEKQFDILHKNRQQQFTSVNGRSESYTDWYLTLKPKKKGKLTIPSLELDGASSKAIEITVSEGSIPAQASGENPVFLETEIDKEQLYTQEQLLLTYRFYMATTLQDIGRANLNIPGTEVIHVASTQFHKQINGITYRVYEIKFALFPQTSGELVIPQIHFSGYLPRGGRDPFFGSLYRNGKRFTLLSDEKRITVRHKPTNTAADWLPAKGVALSERWSSQPGEWRVGEPLTRTITVTGLGTTSTLLPKITIPENGHYRVYPDQPELDQTVNSTGVVSTRTESIAIVPSKPGTIDLPPIIVEWWDTSSNSIQVTKLQGQTLNVLPAEGNAYTPPMPEPTQLTDSTGSTGAAEENTLLLNLSVAANILLAIAVIILFRRSRQPSVIAVKEKQTSGRAETEKKLYEAIRTAANNNERKTLRESMIQWAQHYWKTEAITTLDQIGSLIGDEALNEQFNVLDQSLYGQAEATVDTKAIANTIKRLRANGSAATSANTGRLRPLYPS